MTERTLRVYQLGTTTYEDVHRLQQRLQEQRRSGDGEDALLLTEHRPVITLGRAHPDPSLRVPAEEIAARGIAIVQAERGGDVTFHGPGQLVAYGVIDLRAWDLGVVDYVTGLEETVIGLLADWGLRGERVPGARGVWVGGRKIASVGVHVRGGVTMHGIAVNISDDLSGFDLINPCGMSEVEMTSLSREMGKPVPVTSAAEAFIFHAARVLSCTIESVDMEQKRAAALG
ncbi:MAG: lipoyl(octanoyl) transferase LipB [Dehalococcoidia bacterium]